MTFKRIYELRESKNLKQTDLAKLLTVHQTTYSDYELGKVNIPIPILIKLAKFYGTSIDYIVGLTKNPNPYEKE